MRSLFLRFLTLSTHNIMLVIMFISKLLTFFIYLYFSHGCILLYNSSVSLIEVRLHETFSFVAKINNVWMLSQQESQPAGNRTRRTARSITCPRGVPLSCPPPPGQDWGPPNQDWGTPGKGPGTRDLGKNLRMDKQSENITLPHPSDAGGEKHAQNRPGVILCVCVSIDTVLNFEANATCEQGLKYGYCVDKPQLFLTLGWIVPKKRTRKSFKCHTFFSNESLGNLELTANQLIFSDRDLQKELNTDIIQ